MKIKTGRRVNYQSMTVLAFTAGCFGIVFQFMPDGKLLSFMVSVAALGGLIGGRNDYDERDRQQLGQSFKTAYEWLLLAVMAAYAFIILSRWLGAVEGAVIFLNDHWPGLIISSMCLLMGAAGWQSARGGGSP